MKEKQIKFCPSCQGKLIKTKELAEGVFLCSICGWSWLLLSLVYHPEADHADKRTTRRNNADDPEMK